MSETLKYITIASMDGDESVKLTAGMNDNGTYYMPSIIFKNAENKDLDVLNVDGNVYWDNPDFIFVEFVDFLNRWKDRKLKVGDETDFKEIWNLLDEDWVDEVLEILNDGIKLGLNKCK